MSFNLIDLDNITFIFSQILKISYPDCYFFVVRQSFIPFLNALRNKLFVIFFYYFSLFLLTIKIAKYKIFLYIYQQMQQKKPQGKLSEFQETDVLGQSERLKRQLQRREQLLGRQSTIVQFQNLRCSETAMDNFQFIMENNKIWAECMVRQDKDFFKNLVNIQKPQYLWIGCSDSRVPANQIVGLKPGELFVHRNIANMAPLSDINALSVVQYSVQVLKVTDIIVCGHYGCGGIRAAFKKHDHGPLQAWLSHIRDLRARYRKQLKYSDEQNENLLVQLNVKQQVYNLARIPIVQKAWKDGQELRIHGLVYQLENGLLKDLSLTISKTDQLPEEYRIY